MRREGGREEGREEEERFLKRRGRQDMQEEKEEEKEEGKHRGGLFQSRGCVLTGALYMLVSNRGGTKHWPDTS